MVRVADKASANRLDLNQRVGVDLSLIIVTWNCAEVIHQCLQSVYANTPACSSEIVVVDNASSDDTVDIVRVGFPDIIVIINGSNMGFATANNQGIAHSQGRYVALLNPDTVVLPSALTTMVAYMDAHPEAGAAGC
mgnify:CR=1 FL=1